MVQRYIYEPQKVASLEAHDIVRVAGGNQHTLALTKSGKVLSFGRTTYGRLGRLNEDFESNVAQEEPRAVDGLFQVHANSISAGKESSHETQYVPEPMALCILITAAQFGSHAKPI